MGSDPFNCLSPVIYSSKEVSKKNGSLKRSHQNKLKVLLTNYFYLLNTNATHYNIRNIRTINDTTTIPIAAS